MFLALSQYWIGALRQIKAPSELVFLLLLSSLLIACSSPTTDPSSQSTAFRITAPFDASFNRNVDSSALTLIVMIDGVAQELAANQDNSLWTGNFALPADRAVELSIAWEHNGFLLARFDESVGPITEFTNLSVSTQDYQTTGEEFDADADGFSNLQELNNNTNPSDAQNIDVRIPAVPAAGVPGINGVTGLVWEENIIADWQNAPLSIDNLMIDLGTALSDGETGYTWQALHDGASLFIIVYVEDIANETPQADSTNPVRDDAINIFIDGDNSKLESYDGDNDFHIIIPLLKLLEPQDTAIAGTVVTDVNGDFVFDESGLLQVETTDGLQVLQVGDFENNSNVNTLGRAFYGTNSAPPLEFLRYSNGRGQSQQVYEIKLILDQLGIEVGQPFGIDVQVDSDDDGGNRDARFGWKHPSKQAGGADVNNTVNNPAFMGTAILEPSF